MKERKYFIEISKDIKNYLDNDLFRKVIQDFLSENEAIDLSKMISNNNLAETYIEVLNNDNSHVKDSELLYDTLERIYDFWRSSKRYVLSNVDKPTRINKDTFLSKFDLYNENLLKTYRSLCYKLTGRKFSVYRQLPAFADVIMLLKNNDNVPYKELSSARLISKVAFRTPFISYSASNKRTGVFPIVDESPIKGLDITDDQWFIMPILSGETKVHVYFPRRYVSLGVSLSNLFQYDDGYRSSKPDAIIVFGSNTVDGVYYDKEKDIYIGSLVKCDKIDYFGYMKKIILTVHNVRMIKQGKLPIHGAGVSIAFKNGVHKNVVIMGDSGAGKSETLEALREISNGEILDMTTIYDDMGYFEIIDGKVYTSGTEIGAFVRTDDLANDYVYKVFDRAIFLNPSKKNSRLVLPITPYHDVIKKYPVDFVFYANNYEESKNKVVLSKDVNEILSIFESGKRVALGTTAEEGFVSTFFANPFGPVQLKEEAEKLINEYFDLLLKNNISVGQLYTGLALPNGKENPQLAAEELLYLINK